MERAKLSISPLFQGQLKEALMQAGACEEKSEQNCHYRLDFNTSAGWVRVKQFTNGTFYLEATDKQTYEKLLSVVQEVTGSRASESVTSKAPKKSSKASDDTRGFLGLDGPYIGTDESGKGDYFGPLVIAGVYTTPEISEKLKALGVMDSKRLKDAQMKQMAQQIKALLTPNAFEIIEIGPSKYNDLYDRFKSGGKNLNHLLAWGHAKVLENLLAKNPTCTQAIADQFGSEHYIRSQLQNRGKQITLHQTPKAEANMGVAAASILARVRFVEKLDALGRKYGTTLPPGAGTPVLNRAKALVNTHGSGILKEIAKLHFKTTAALQ